MTKSTDKSLIEDTEIPAEELVEDLVEDREVTDLTAGDEPDGREKWFGVYSFHSVFPGF